MADFLAQVQLPFAHVEPNLAVGIRKQKTSKEQYAARRIKKLFKSSEAAFTGLDPKQVMIVTTCENLLRAARVSFTCPSGSGLFIGGLPAPPSLFVPPILLISTVAEPPSSPFTPAPVLRRRRPTLHFALGSARRPRIMTRLHSNCSYRISSLFLKLSGAQIASPDISREG